MHGQHFAVVPRRSLMPEADSLTRLREEVALLTMLVAEQNRLLAQIAEQIDRRLGTLERLIDARASTPTTPITRFDIPGRPANGPARDAVVRRHGVGRGLDALIPPREP